MDKPTERYTYDYPHPAVATDCVVFGFDGKELKVLLVERGQEPYKGMWAFPGGFLRIDETAEECAKRELREETGLVLTKVRQLGTFTGLNRDPRERVISIAFYSLARHSTVRGGDDATKARWWAIDDVPQLAFDHDYILRQAMKRLRQDIHFEPVGFDLLDEHFTIAELQRLYECILGVHFDRRNFYRKMLQTGVLQEVEEDDDTIGSLFYGKNNEMQRMDIDSLFAEPTTMCHDSCPAIGDAAPAPEADKEERLRMVRKWLKANSTADPMCDDDTCTPKERNRGVGRKGKIFRFNQEKYDQMKEDGSFRLEF